MGTEKFSNIEGVKRRVISMQKQEYKNKGTLIDFIFGNLAAHAHAHAHVHALK